MQRTSTRTPQRVTPILDRDDSRSEFDANEQLHAHAQRFTQRDDRDTCESFDFCMHTDYLA